MKNRLLAKKNYIKVDMEIPATVLGIASNEKIWKLCWEINQALEISMGTGIDDLTQLKTRDVYLDQESDPSFEFSLFDKKLINAKKAPKTIREFRYFFVIRSFGDREPDVRTYLEALNRIDIVSIAVDLTEVKDIKNIIP